MTLLRATLSGFFTILFFLPAFSQLQFSLEVRPRSEYRHGFKTLADLNQDPAFFTDQRTRFNSMFTDENITLKVTLQDVRVWGNQPQLVIGDGNLTAIHEAWAKFKIGESASKYSLKLGRQEISYDDQRIFGAVGWAQQARSHDAAVLIYEDSTFTGHLGLAFNQNSARLFETIYTVNNYKALQYLWLNKKWGTTNLSFLFLNNGRQVLDANGAAAGTNFSQTIGGRLGFKLSNIQINAATYYQGGTQANLQDTKINAYYAALDLNFPLANGHKIIVGTEILSGNSQTDNNEENNAFSPFYGTNHKFNGLMDYFFVGNHANNVGLNDLFLTWGMKKAKFNTGVSVHFFSANGAVADFTGDKMSSYLGTEVDFTFGFPISKGVSLAGGYSQMFGTETLVSIKNAGSTNATSNWFWTMVTIKPAAFKINTK